MIGRKQELEQLKNALKAHRHVLLEGPVGVGKTTLALSAAVSLSKTESDRKASFIRIDGDSRYTEQRLVGSWDPSRVSTLGFVNEAFLPGPLTRAMQEGRILLINELNRMSEAVQNILLPALDEKLIQITQLGTITAQPGFSVIATQNPRDFVGTSSISEALLDRFEWISMDYPSREEELEILKSKSPDKSSSSLELIIDLVRLTRTFPKLRRGASVRTALAIQDLMSDASEKSFWDAVLMALPTRIEIAPGAYPGLPFSMQIQSLITDLKSQLKKKS
ncbi:MAG: MoxR family ATPase [Xanthomonadaceae bacterium]|nr:MoxR family ATPase [Xanthomonadaceae bacterium]